MVTIKEIAQQLGVSTTTVSNVINGHTNKMSEETRLRVEAALARCHYVGESRRTDLVQDLRLISLDFCQGRRPEQMSDPFCSQLMGALFRELREQGRYLVSDWPVSDDEILRKLQARNVEGGILVGYDAEKCVRLARRTDKPLVFIDSGDGEYDNVGLQDFEGAYEITSYLISQGHRRIAFFFDFGGYTASSRERYRGFGRAMVRAGLPVSEEDCFQLPMDRHLRYDLLRSFARTRAGAPYTAALFVSDLFASEAINIFSAQGITVPAGISVCGFDDNIYAELSRPKLTTVRQHPEDKAHVAVEMLMKRIHGEPVQVSSVHLPVELIVRDSVRNIGLKE